MEKITKIGCGEYGTYYVTDASNIYYFQYNGAVGTSVITKYPISVGIVSAAGCLHNGTLLDVNGNVWTFGDNTYGQRGNNTTGGDGSVLQVTKDSKGNAFSGISQITGYVNTNLALKKDGTVWYWGADYLNLFGSNQLSPVALPIPSGVTFTKIVEQSPLLGLDSNGGVWEWKAGSKSPTQVSLPAKASDIAACANGVSFAVIGGFPYGWSQGQATTAWGIPTAPTVLAKQWQMPAAIAGTPGSIVGNDNTLHYIDINGNMWGLGDNQMGEVGNGDETNFSVITPPNQLYAWDWTRYLRMVRVPVMISSGVKFSQICTQNSDVFYVYAQDTTGNWWSWGRNKGLALGDHYEIRSDIASLYPNLIDQPLPQITNPLNAKVIEVNTLAQGIPIYTANTGYGRITTTTTSTTTSTTSTTTSTTSSTTTTTTTKHWPYITIYNDRIWDYGGPQ